MNDKIRRKRNEEKRVSKHNIYLSDEGNLKNKVVIKGNDLELRWLNDSILVWSKKNNSDILRSILYEINNSLKQGKKENEARTNN